MGVRLKDLNCFTALAMTGLCRIFDNSVFLSKLRRPDIETSGKHRFACQIYRMSKSFDVFNI